MANIAFYAPMKSPNARKASGDSTIAKSFYTALEQNHSVTLASDFSSWEGYGNVVRQQQIKEKSLTIAELLLSQYQDNPELTPDAWFTYHCYHKAPDWLGLTITKALKIPYIISEFSIAPKQLNGRWHDGYEASQECLAQASAIIINNQNDQAMIESFISEMQLDTQLFNLKPFLNDDISNVDVSRERLAKQYHLQADKKWLVIVAQMREGDKMASYDIAMKVISQLFNQESHPYQWIIIGDGSGMSTIKQWAAKLNQQHSESVRLLGELNNHEVKTLLKQGRLLFWPAVNEAIGMVFLEAMSVGLPVVTCAKANSEGGIKNVVYHEKTGFIVNDFCVSEQVNSIKKIANNNQLFNQISAQSKQCYVHQHDFYQAAERLNTIIKTLS